MYRRRPTGLEVFLVHPGGPFFARRDAESWSVPKGEVHLGEDGLDAARREFEEETGRADATCAVREEFLPLGSIVQRGGKTVEAWAFEGDWPADLPIRCNTFRLEWPPRSGRFAEFPEIDRAQFFDLDEARRRILPAQRPLLDRLQTHLAAAARAPDLDPDSIG